MKKIKSDKRVLSKLLAREGVHVIYNPAAKTASFDLQKRILELPIIVDAEEYIYDWFIAHEVSHALNTPTDDWENFDRKEVPQGYVNVTEDARIEKLIQRQYPGLTRQYHKFYKEFSPANKDFFKVKDKDLKKLSLINRINLHTKLGISKNLVVPFALEELQFVDRAEKLETFEEALQLAKDIYRYVKENQQSDPEQENSEESETGGESDQQSDESEESMDSSDMSGDSVEGGTGEKQDNKENAKDKKKESSAEGKENEKKKSKKESALEKVETQEQFDSAFSNTFEKSNKALHEFPTLTDKIQITDTTLEKLPINSDNIEAYQDFHKSYKDHVNFMISRFNMKKSAANFTKTRESMTGKLDIDKLAEYKTRNDMFLTSEISSTDKNHGFMFFIDWSGSMGDIIKETIIQLSIFLEFCQKINVPFAAYGFTTGGNVDIGPLGISSDVRVFKIVDSNMSTKQYKNSIGRILANQCKIPMRWTPLNATAIIADKLVENFMASHKVDKMNLVFMSDGGASDDTASSYINDNITGSLVEYSGWQDLVALIKKRRKINRTIGVYLSSSASACVSAANVKNFKGMKSPHEQSADFVKNGFIDIPNPAGFDKFYGVSSTAVLGQELSEGKKYAEKKKWDMVRGAGQLGPLLKSRREDSKKSLLFLRMFIDYIS